jgi:hypothetical protein
MNGALMWKSIGIAVVMSSTSAAVAAGPDGLWTGTYVCAQGETPLELYVTTPAGGTPTALFHFGDGSADRPEGCFAMAGSQTPAAMVFTATDWRLRPPGYVTVNLLGSIAQGHYTGMVAGPGCTSFDLTWHPIALVPTVCLPPGAVTS